MVPQTAHFSTFVFNSVKRLTKSENNVRGPTDSTFLVPLSSIREGEMDRSGEISLKILFVLGTL